MRHVIGKAVSETASEEFKQNQSQRIHIRGRGDGLAAELLGAGVLQCHDAHARGHAHGAGEHVRVEDFGNPEIEQLGDTFRGYENIAGLEVAMNHQMLMRVMNGGANGSEESQARIDA